MKILIEALAVDFGGIRTYVENLLRGWELAQPGDELLVAIAAGSDLDTGVHQRYETRIPRPQVVGRPLAHTFALRRLARDFGADAVLATMPSTSLLNHDVPLAVVVHDLRHELRPAQFSRARRELRRLAYGRSYSVAAGFLCVSQRTLNDLHALHPGIRTKPAVVVHHGADHVGQAASWPRRGPALTFAHHTNKNPHLVIDAWAAGQATGLELPPLWVLGAGRDRHQLQRRIDDLGLDAQVSLQPYLSDATFRDAFTAAQLLVFPSDFEGFGLPVLEAMALDVPVVVGPDPAVLEVAGGHATVMTGWDTSALVDALERSLASAAQPGRGRAALEHAATFTWRRSAHQTRTFLQQLVADSP